MQKQPAFTLIETLLIVAIVGVILLFGARYIWRYQKSSQRFIVSSDIKRLFFQSEKYFVIADCENNSSSQCHYQPDIARDLNLPELSEGRHPLITQYQVNIINTGLEKKDQTPIYQIQITAILNKALQQTEIESLEKEWNADRNKSNPAMSILIWNKITEALA